MRILFSAALNFKMINKTRSVDSRGSLKYSRADKVMSKQKMGTVKTGGGVGREFSVNVFWRNWFDYKANGHDLNVCLIARPAPTLFSPPDQSTGEGNGNTLQCSCLENPREWGAWWAAIYGVTQSRTRLKRLSSSSSSSSSPVYRIKPYPNPLHYSLWPSLTNSAYALPWLPRMNLSHTAAAHTSNFLDANFLTVTKFSLFVRTCHFPEIRLLNAHMDGPRECHTGWSKSDRGEILYDIPYMWNLKRNDTNELMYKRETDSQTLRTSLVRGKDGSRNS